MIRGELRGNPGFLASDGPVLLAEKVAGKGLTVEARSRILSLVPCDRERSRPARPPSTALRSVTRSCVRSPGCPALPGGSSRKSDGSLSDWQDAVVGFSHHSGADARRTRRASKYPAGSARPGRGPNRHEAGESRNGVARPILPAGPLARDPIFLPSILASVVLEGDPARARKPGPVLFRNESGSPRTSPRPRPNRSGAVAADDFQESCNRRPSSGHSPGYPGPRALRGTDR